MNTVDRSLPAAPNRLISAFLHQKVRLLSAIRDEGGLFECRFLLRLIGREKAGVATAADGASKIKDTVSTMRQMVLQDLSPSDDTPGVIDPREADELLKTLGALGTQTRHHVGQLEHLT